MMGASPLPNLTCGNLLTEGAPRPYGADPPGPGGFGRLPRWHADGACERAWWQFIGYVHSGELTHQVASHRLARPRRGWDRRARMAWSRRRRRRYPRPKPPRSRRRHNHVAAGRPVAPLTELGRVTSPGGWAAPPGVRPGWNWGPPDGMVPRTDRAPRWVRWWCATPFVDRYAYAWMWWHGAWDVFPPALRGQDGGGTAGVREPRQPATPSGAGAAPIPQGPEAPSASTGSAAPDM